MSSFFQKAFEKDAKGQYFWERDIFGKDSQASPIILAELCRQMSFMLGAGVTLRIVITVLIDTYTKNRRKNRRLQVSLQNVLDNIMGGSSLSQALEETGHFPTFMSSMCRIGEMSDDLPKVMALLADYYEEMARNRDEIKSALLYPAVVTVMMLAMILIAVLYVLPHYALVFAISDVPLPVLTQVLLNISDILITRWWLVTPIMVLIAMLPVAIVRTPQGRSALEWALLNIPLISTVYRQMINLQVVQALALLLQSSQPLSDAVLAVSGIIPNKRVAHDLQQVTMGLQEGTAFWVLLAKIPYMDATVISMARVGEETGNMAQVFEHASSYSRHQFRQMTRRLNKMVEPAVTLVLGLVLGLVMLSIILPTFAMTELVGY
ncbi:MAG: type II secretion system F family protein [Defluviitaleaceae bacterium]|nr:type II secretion system F family protein [Defluviitaleaceae bacterium]